jgi:hypothetical protein
MRESPTADVGLRLRSRTSSSGGDALQDAQNFSLVLGGPLFQLLCKVHLSDDAMLHLRQRVLVISLCAWLPLFVLSALQGDLVGHHIAVPFLLDLEVHIRFLVVVPLLIIAELVVHRRLHRVALAFLDRNLIPQAALSQFDEALTAAYRLRNSVLAELVLLVLVYVVGVQIVWRHLTALDAATWYVTSSAAGSRLMPAGIWYGYFSLPLFQFLLLRWYFRLFIWVRFLWRVSRIELSLVPTHPDRLGGLGFLSRTVYAFAVLLVAHGAMVASQLANRIFYLGAGLPEFKGEIVVMVVFLLCVVFGPLLVFTPQLAQAKRAGLDEYGKLAEQYVREFDVKWLHGGGPRTEPLVGSADIQSLADLDSSYEIVRTMRWAPISRQPVLELAAAVLVPIAPLLLTMMPLETLFNKLLGLLF